MENVKSFNTRGDLGTIRPIQRKILEFGATSVLKVNPAKSNAYFGGVPIIAKQQILLSLGCDEGEFPFPFLRVPLNGASIQYYQPLLDRVLAKVKCRTSSYLSYTGRIPLVLSVLHGIQSFWAQMFILPQKVLQYVDAIC